jgi:hypothetical protein
LSCNTVKCYDELIKLFPNSSFCFVIVIGLVWSNDLDSYANSNIATGRASLAGQVEGDDPNKSDTLVPHAECLGYEANNSPPLKKNLPVEKPNKGGQGCQRAVEPRSKEYKTAVKTT